MKKLDAITFIAIIITFVGLLMLHITGLTVHILISIFGLFIVIVSAILGKKDWQYPSLEISYRALYLLTLITGIYMTATYVTDVASIIHKITCAMFGGLFVITFIIKLNKN